ncbi:MAG: regulatory protein RecX [Enterobacterales bacterium]|nr:regulatory protein RecX [Enterobacterales bacterium]
MRNQLTTQGGELEFQQALSSACRMLAIREHSERQIRQKLSKKGFSTEVLDPCINYLIEENWLCEKRFCHLYIRSKAAKGQGEIRIVNELQKQGLDKLTIDQGLHEELIDWQNICDQTLEKKLRLVPDYQPILESCVADDQRHMLLNKNWPLKQRIKLERFLRYRGFSEQQIKLSIKNYLSNIRSFER